jgi:hypothetical protein
VRKRCFRASNGKLAGSEKLIIRRIAMLFATSRASDPVQSCSLAGYRFENAQMKWIRQVIQILFPLGQHVSWRDGVPVPL